jgi:hypothetical protein
MKKQLIIIGITVVLLAVGLSGCNSTEQNQNNQMMKKIDLLGPGKEA